MPESSALHSYGAILEVSADGITYAEIEGAEVIDIMGPKKSTGEMKATHLASPDTTEETKPGLLRPGEVTFKMAFIGTALAEIETYYQARATKYWKIKFPLDSDNGEVTAATYTGRGFIKEIGNSIPDADSDERVMCDINIRCRSKWTFTEGS